MIEFVKTLIQFSPVIVELLIEFVKPLIEFVKPLIQFRPHPVGEFTIVGNELEPTLGYLSVSMPQGESAGYKPILR